ncbi:Uncharacterised protein [Halioglobus japonicus]|nr:Uncharacterised protein [Halioglobus japonicus]
MTSTNHTLSHAAQIYYQELLSGTTGKDGGLIALHEGLKNALSNMQSKADEQSPPGSTPGGMPTSDPYSIGSQRKLASLKRTVSHLGSIINRINLFNSRDEMHDLYPLLLAELTEEQRWRVFLSSALRANVAANPHREMVAQSKSLAGEIASTAGRLADQINRMYAIELDNMPEAFFSLWQLLHRTKESDWAEPGFSKWCDAKNAILGEPHLWPEPSTTLKPMDHPSPAYDLIKDDLSDCLARIQNTIPPLEDLPALHSAWTSAPPVQTLLRTLEHSASDFSGSNTGGLRTSVQSQKPDSKIDYIRSLAYLLTEEHQIPISINIKKAIAIAATVSLSELHVAVSYNDVCNALA